MKILLTLIAIIGIGFSKPELDAHLEPLALKLSEVTGYAPEIALYEVFGELTFEMVERDYSGYSCWSTLKCYGQNPLESELADGLLIHELGHKFLNMQKLSFAEIELSLGYYEDGHYIHVAGINPQTGRFERTDLGYPSGDRPWLQHGKGGAEYNTYQEDFADMFMNWARGTFSDDEAGRLRNEWMNNFVDKYTKKNVRSIR